MFAAAVVAVVAGSAGDSGVELDPIVFIAAALLCAAGNLFEVFAPANFSFQPNLIIFFSGALLLPPWALAVLAFCCFAPGWVVHRFPWYMVSFNTANYALAGMAASWVAGIGHAVGSSWSPNALTALSLAGAAIAFVFVNHGLIALVVTATRGRSLRKSARDVLEVMPMDVALAMTGACLVALWVETPALALLVAAPMILIHRALWVPLLEHKSRTDPKTGLYNSDYLSVQLDDALGRARRRSTGLSVVMIDLDQLRGVNNRYGHLAGDQAIRAAADVAADAAANSNGLAARFGGDELCLLLPETPLAQASEVAEEVRRRIAEIDLPGDHEGERVTITVSAGVASFPEHADSVDDLLRAADAAVYDAKLGGRNRSRLAIPQSARGALEMPPEPSPARSTPKLELGDAPGLEASSLAGLNGGGPAYKETGERNGSDPMPLESPATAGADETADPGPRRDPFTVKVYVAALCAAAAVVGLVAGGADISSKPGLFVLLVGAVVGLDAVRIDVFERANLSPAAVPELALAFFFGPLGPIVAEGAIALMRAVRRDETLKWAFDLGALSLAGAAAALTFDRFADASGVALILVAGLAGIAYYAVNSALLAVVMGLAERRSPLGVWRERLAWMTAHYVIFGLVAGTFVVSELNLGLYALAVFALPVVMLWVAEKQYLDRSRATVTELRQTNDDLEQANTRLRTLLDDNQQLLGRMHRSYISTITSLARTVEAKDPLTSGHTERVADIALLLAAELGFDESQLPAVRVGAIIHDIGKIGIPDQILLKPGPLDDDEFATMKKHPEMSSYIVAELELPAIVKQMVRSHHERWDGRGYPDGLMGEEIPLAARILTVADAFDAMTSDRPYRNALPIDVAQAEIKDKAGSQFCPRVVEALIRSMDQNPGFWDEQDEAAPAPAAPA